MTDIKVGDIVHVRGEVHFREPNYSAQYMISFDGGRDYARVTRAEIVHVEPRQFKVGDRVRNNCISPQCMTIIAIDGPFAWIKTDDPRTRYTCSLDKLTFVETK